MWGVQSKKYLQAVQCPLSTQRAKEFHKALWLNQVSVNYAALDVWQVSVVLQCPHVQLCLLTQLGNAWPVIVGECAICQNGICHLGVGDQVDLQELQHQGSCKSDIIGTCTAVDVNTVA